MTCFDALADESYKPKKEDWLNDARYVRRFIMNEKIIQKRNGQTTRKDGLTWQREEFLKKHGVQIEARDRDDETRAAQGPSKPLLCSKPAWLPESSVNLSAFPRYSARLLLTFRLLTPLITKDDDPFYLFDNPARKDHLLGLPYLSAASLKGLSADAYQRAFPGTTPWTELSDSKKDPDLTRAFRHADPHAKRLFGIADDGAKIESEKGRLHFSPVWFNNLQLLVMNPGNPANATGTLPIQFEAIAPNQTGVLEVVYFNPHGIKDSDEKMVREDLARWLAAVAAWWPALGLGAKRLAGYGAIRIEKVELQAVGWFGMTEDRATAAPAIPDFVQEFQNETGELIPQSALDSRMAPAGEAGEQLKALDQEKKRLTARKLELQQNRQQAGADKELKQVKKEIDRMTKEIAALRKPLEQKLQALKNRYRNAQIWLKNNPQTSDLATADVAQQTPLIPDERSETGLESWLKMAHWIAGE